MLGEERASVLMPARASGNGALLKLIEPVWRSFAIDLCECADWVSEQLCRAHVVCSINQASCNPIRSFDHLAHD